MCLCYFLLKIVSVTVAFNYRITKMEQVVFSPLSFIFQVSFFCCDFFF